MRSAKRFHIRSKSLVASGLVALSGVFLIGFQNCGFGATPPLVDGGSFRLASDGDGDEPIDDTPAYKPPVVGVNDSNCLSNPAYDACVFNQNPVVQSNSPVPTTTTWYDSIASRQVYGVKLTGVGSSGLLENNTLAVQVPGDVLAASNPTGTRTRRSSSKSFRVAVNSETAVASKGGGLSEISSYFWLTHFIDRLEGSGFIDQNFVSGSSLKVYPLARAVDGAAFQNAAFYSGGSHLNNIIIGYGNIDMPLAYSADVIVHEFTHALVHHGSGTLASQVSTATHQYCLQNAGVSAQVYQQSGICCNSIAGCMKAMNEGLADFYASVVFEANPVIGEGFTNDLTGLRSCGASSPNRDVRANVSRTMSSVYSICTLGVNNGGTVTQYPRPGEIYTMSTSYSSALWEVRRRVKSALPSMTIGGVVSDGGRLFEMIVYDHIMSLTGTSTFASSRTALKNSAEAIVASENITLPAGVSITQIIDAEFTRRGIAQ